MLVKKKLLQMPLPKHPGEEGCCVNAYVEDKIYHLALWDGKNLLERVYSDGKNVIVYNEEKRTWGTSVAGYASYHYHTDRYKEPEKCLRLTKDFFEEKWGRDSLYIITMHVSDKRSERRRQSRERAYDRMVDNINSFPDDPKELAAYCDTYVFKKYYAIVDPGEKNRKSESCRCTACGRKFKQRGKLRQREMVACPKCGQRLTTIHQRYLSSAHDSAKVLVFLRRGDGAIAARWEKITRRYLPNGKPQYEKDPYRWELHHADGKIERYKWQACAYQPADYRVERCDSTGQRAFVYAGNIKEIFQSIHGVDPTKLRDAGEVDLQTLSEALKTENGKTLYKLGLYRLAETAQFLPKGGTFKQTLGVGKEYLEIMKELNISRSALKIMSLSEKHLTNDQVRKIVQITSVHGFDFDQEIREILKYMSLERLINYFCKQHCQHPIRSLENLFSWYLDYRRMTGELNEQLGDGRKINTSASAYIMPRDIKVAHDEMAKRLKIIKNTQKERIIRKLGERLQKNKPFESDGLMIVYPKSMGDFVQEGSELKHCIGSGMRYIDAQANGDLLSVFIRRVERPDKPYYTATFALQAGFGLKECHGMGNKMPPEKVKKLLNKYQEYMQTNEKKAGKENEGTDYRCAG